MVVIGAATLAFILFVFVIAQVGELMSMRRFHQRRKSRNLESLSDDSPVTSTAKDFDAPVPAWDGFRVFLVKRKVIEDEAGSVCSFYLAPADDHPLPAFIPGQFLTFRLHIEDPVQHEIRTLVRCYPLSDRPNPDYYRVTIKRNSSPAELTDASAGLTSNVFHDRVQEGTRLMVKAPSGHFHLMFDRPIPIVLVCDGIGIAPMLSIINTLLYSILMTVAFCGVTREIWLYYGVRNGTEHVMKEYLESLRKAYPNFHLHVCYSHPIAEDMKGVDYHYRGLIDIQLLRSTLKTTRYQFYVCGPRQMIETLVPTLEEWTATTDDIHYQALNPSSLIKCESLTRQITTGETPAYA